MMNDEQKKIIDDLQKQINKDFTNNGCKISDVRTLMNSKLWINTFYDVEPIFQDLKNIECFSNLIINDLKNAKDISEDDTVVFYGFDDYALILLQTLVDKWNSEPNFKHNAYWCAVNVGKEKNSFIFSDSVLENKLKDKSKNLKVIEIISLGTTMSPFYKLRSMLKQEFDRDFDFKSYYCLIAVGDIFDFVTKDGWENNKLVLSDKHDEHVYIESIEKYADNVWATISVKKTSIKDSDKNIPVKYCLYGEANWYLADKISEKMKINDSKDFIFRPLINTDKSLTRFISTLQTKIPDNAEKFYSKTDNGTLFLNDSSNKIIDDPLFYYGHIDHEDNHYQFYFDYSNIFNMYKREIVEWLEKQNKNNNDSNYYVLVSPYSSTNSKFTKAVLDAVINNQKNIDKDIDNVYFLHIDVNKTSKEDIRTKYQFLSEKLKKKNDPLIKNIKFYYISDTVYTGKSIERAVKYISIILNHAGLYNKYLEDGFLFDRVYLLLNRCSFETAQLYVSNPADEWLSYINILIPSYNMAGGKCPECKFVDTYQDLLERSNTNKIQEIFKYKIKKHSVIDYKTLNPSYLYDKVDDAWLKTYYYYLNEYKKKISIAKEIYELISKLINNNNLNPGENEELWNLITDLLNKNELTKEEQNKYKELINKKLIGNLTPDDEKKFWDLIKIQLNIIELIDVKDKLNKFIEKWLNNSQTPEENKEFEEFVKKQLNVIELTEETNNKKIKLINKWLNKKLLIKREQEKLEFIIKKKLNNNELTEEEQDTLASAVKKQLINCELDDSNRIKYNDLIDKWLNNNKIINGNYQKHLKKIKARLYDNKLIDKWLYNTQTQEEKNELGNLFKKRLNNIVLTDKDKKKHDELIAKWLNNDKPQEEKEKFAELIKGYLSNNELTEEDKKKHNEFIDKWLKNSLTPVEKGKFEELIKYKLYIYLLVEKWIKNSLTPVEKKNIIELIKRYLKNNEIIDKWLNNSLTLEEKIYFEKLIKDLLHDKEFNLEELEKLTKNILLGYELNNEKQVVLVKAIIKKMLYIDSLTFEEEKTLEAVMIKWLAKCDLTEEEQNEFNIIKEKIILDDWYKRLYTMNKSYKELVYKKEPYKNSDDAIKDILNLLAGCFTEYTHCTKYDQVRLFISYIKVISREYVAHYYYIREAIYKILHGIFMLMLLPKNNIGDNKGENIDFITKKIEDISKLSDSNKIQSNALIISIKDLFGSDKDSNKDNNDSWYVIYKNIRNLKGSNIITPELQYRIFKTVANRLAMMHSTIMIQPELLDSYEEKIIQIKEFEDININKVLVDFFESVKSASTYEKDNSLCYLVNEFKDKVLEKKKDIDKEIKEVKNKKKIEDTLCNKKDYENEIEILEYSSGSSRFFVFLCFLCFLVFCV